MDRFDEMRGKISSKSNNNNTNEITGILPMPVSGLSVVQNTDPKDSVHIQMAVPEEATGVDILIQGNSIPSGLNDYSQIVSVGNVEELDITINQSSRGKYEDKYGFWAISKNSYGKQTALNGSNTKLLDFYYNKDLITLTLNTSISTNFYSGYSPATAVAEDLIFITQNASQSNKINTLYVVDKSAKKIIQASGGARGVSNATYLSNGYYLLSSGTTGYLYNHNDNTVTSVTGSVDLTAKAERGGYVLVGGYNAMCTWDGSSLTNHYITGCYIIDTSYGIFIHGNSLKKYVSGSFESCTYQSIKSKVETSEGSGEYIVEYNEPVTLSKADLFEDSLGNLYASTGTHSSGTYLYAGSNNFLRPAIGEASLGTSAFKMGRYYYYMNNYTLYKYSEEGIIPVCASGQRSSGNHKAVSFGNGYLIYRKDAVIYSGNYDVVCYFNGTSCRAVSCPDTVSGTSLVDGDRVYFSNSGNVFFYLYMSGDEVKYQTVSTTACGYLTKIGGELYGIRSGTVYHIDEDGTATSICSYDTRGASVDIMGHNGNVYVIPYGTSLSYITSVYEYDPSTKTATATTEHKGGMKLATDYYCYPSDKKIYSLKNDDIITTFNSVNIVRTNSFIGYVNTSGITVAYFD